MVGVKRPLLQRQVEVRLENRPRSRGHTPGATKLLSSPHPPNHTHTHTHTVAPSDRCLCLNWQKCALTPSHPSNTQKNPFLPHNTRLPLPPCSLWRTFVLFPPSLEPNLLCSAPVSPYPLPVCTPLFIPNLFMPPPTPHPHTTLNPTFFILSNSHTHSGPSYGPRSTLPSQCKHMHFHAETRCLDFGPTVSHERHEASSLTFRSLYFRGFCRFICNRASINFWCGVTDHQGSNSDSNIICMSLSLCPLHCLNSAHAMQLINIFQTHHLCVSST